MRVVSESESMTHRRRNLPLHALPAFEAAARHGSFRLAAAELHLTPSAISHQIRVLEDALGMRLFQRLPRGLKLTEGGANYASTVREALDRLDADGAAASSFGYGRLRVSAPDWVSRFVLVPALARLRAHQPQLDIELNTGMGLVDLEAGDADAAIRFGMGQWGKLRSYRLANFTASVVAAPGLATVAHEQSAHNGELPMVCLEKLEQTTRKTLASIGLIAHPERALRLDAYQDVIQAAEEGLGVTMTFAMSGAVPEENARLVTLSERPIPVPFALYFVCRELEADRPDIATLRNLCVERLSAA